MIFPLTRLLLAAAACCAVAGCALPKLPKLSLRKPVPKATPIRFPKEDPSDPKGKRRQIGKILLVNSEAGFVLVEIRGATPPDPGLALKCFRDGAETGILTVSGERHGMNIIADIVTGTPRKGDQVFK